MIIITNKICHNDFNNYGIKIKIITITKQSLLLYNHYHYYYYYRNINSKYNVFCQL